MIRIPLTENADSTIVGGKASNLMKMKKFNVPQGICITTQAYNLFCEKNKLRDKITKILKSIDYNDIKNIKKSSEKIRKIILEAEMPEEISREIKTPYNHVVVRSSANLEDLPEASFAGQQKTYINPQQVDVAVKMCWASLWTERALSYRRDKAYEKMPEMAVIIQKAILCDVSGVVFTKNPVTHKDEIVIEAVFGLGEPLVSGRVQPDRYVLDSTLTLKKKEIATQEYKLVLTETGTTKEKIKKSIPCLTEEMLTKIGDISLKIETLFQTPQDIEFGVYNNDIFIFQSRPITTSREDVWTRGYADDYWTGVTSPLYFSLLGEFLDVYVNQEGNEILGYTELKGVPLLRYHKAHVYFNTRVLREVFKYNPKFSRVKELLDYFPEHEQEEMKELPFHVWKRIVAELRLLVYDRDGILFNTYKKYNKFSRKYLEKLKKFDKIDLSTLTDGELLEQFAYLYQVCLKHFRLVRWGIAIHSMGMNMILKRLIINWYTGDPDQTHNILVSNLPLNKALETNLAIFDLVKAKREGTFEKKFEKFLKRYGHRSYSRDIIFPTWSENPELVTDMVNSLLENDKDIQEIEAEKRRQQKGLTKKVLQKIRAQKYGFLKKQIFKIILFYAQMYIGFRENQRFFLDHQNFRFRKVFLEMGNRLAERKILKERDDVFFLYKEEVFYGLKSGNINNELLKKRKKDFNQYERKLPPKFLQGTTEFDQEFQYEKELTGTASSPGVVTGAVRLIKSIDELCTIKKGEILVAQCTDPGWTPIFVKIKGLITETGGMLSHGAVISREYGIPAVTGVKNALKILEMGDTIVLDGNIGKIYIR